jgi:hypothetical protein
MMTFEETLRELQTLIGREVVVGVTVDGKSATPAVGIAGELRRAAPTPELSRQLLELTGQAVPDDEAIMFHVGGADEPGRQTYFLLRRSEFTQANLSDTLGVRILHIWSSGVQFIISDREQTDRALESGGAGQ